MPGAPARIAELRELVPDGVAVQVDGGVHTDNIPAVRAAGADVLVRGSGVFWGDDPGAAYRALVEVAGAAGSPEREGGRPR